MPDLSVNAVEQDQDNGDTYVTLVERRGGWTIAITPRDTDKPTATRMLKLWADGTWEEL